MMQDSVEIALALKNVLKSSAGSFKDIPSEVLERALREYELKRAPRTHDMVALARYNVNLVCCKRTWLVGSSHSIFRILRLNSNLHRHQSFVQGHGFVSTLMLR